MDFDKCIDRFYDFMSVLNLLADLMSVLKAYFPKI